MKRNDLYRKDDSVLRVIHVQENQVMVIDCVKCTMPFWMNLADMCSYVEYAEEKYYSDVNFTVVDDACIYTKDKLLLLPFLTIPDLLLLQYFLWYIYRLLIVYSHILLYYLFLEKHFSDYFFFLPDLTVLRA